MNRKTLGLASILVILSMLAAALVEGMMLPADLQLPIHWGLDGEPDRFADKWVALLLPAGITTGVSLLFYMMPSIEPRKEGFARSQGLYRWGWVALLLMGAVIQVSLLSVGFGWGLVVSNLIVGAVGAMLVLIGNQLGKSRSMYLIGVRTPWTLASEDVWIKTHRLCGKLMVLAGLAIVAGALIGLAPGRLAAVAICAVAVSVVVPVLYSFLLWRREQKSDQASG
jgi:uncharacterized membrane protein